MIFRSPSFGIGNIGKDIAGFMVDKGVIHTGDEDKALAGMGSRIVNRIPNVIKARSGFVSIDELPWLTFRVRSLEHYLL